MRARAADGTIDVDRGELLRERRGVAASDPSGVRRASRALRVVALVVITACGGRHAREREPMTESLSSYRSLAFDVVSSAGVDASACDLTRFHARLMERAARADLRVQVVVPAAPADLRARAIVRTCEPGALLEHARVALELELFDVRAGRVIARVDIDAEGSSATLDKNLEVRDHAGQTLDLAAERVVRFLRKHR